MEVQAIALEIVKKHGKEMAKELVLVALVPALEEVVKKTATPIDDVVFAALKEAMIAQIEKI